MEKTTIELSGMEFYAFHGCYSEEQRVGGPFRVDLSFEADTARAAASDDINDTVSYLAVYECVRDEMAQPSHLLEHVARRIIGAVKGRFPVGTVRVRVSKLNPPLGGPVGAASVTMEF